MKTKVFYGEDLLNIDKDLLELKSQYETIIEYDKPDTNTFRSDLLSLGFFAQKRLFVFLNIFNNQVTRGKLSNSINDFMKLAVLQESTNNFLFVEHDSKKIKYYKQFFNKSDYKSYKLTPYLFYFLDNFYIGNFNKCLEYLNKALLKTAPELVFYMFKRRVRELLLLKQNRLVGNYQPWQLSKLKGQLKTWSEKKLISVYKTLYKIERGIKTGGTPLTVFESMQIVLGLFL